MFLNSLLGILFIILCFCFGFLFLYIVERVRARAWRCSFGPDTGRKHQPL